MMSEEQRAKELNYIEEKLSSILQIIDKPRSSRGDVYEQLGKIYARTGFALESVKRLKDEA